MRKTADEWGCLRGCSYKVHCWNSEDEKELKEIEARFEVLEIEHKRLLDTVKDAKMKREMIKMRDKIRDKMRERAVDVMNKK